MNILCRTLLPALSSRTFQLIRTPIISLTQRQKSNDSENQDTVKSTDEEPSIIIKESCVEKILHLRKKYGPEANLRVAVESGGCSGFQYDFAIETAIEEDDTIFKKDGQPYVLIDPVSLTFLNGATVEYSDDMVKQAFSVVDNPNVDSSCGCGVSFGKLDLF